MKFHKSADNVIPTVILYTNQSLTHTRMKFASIINYTEYKVHKR